MRASRYIHLCALHRHTAALQALHATLLTSGTFPSRPLPTALLSAYAKCGLLHHARRLFDGIPHPDPIAWASILSAHNHAAQPARALNLFLAAPQPHPPNPDHFVFACLAKACAQLGRLRLGRQLHARFQLSPWNRDDVAKSALVDMYAKCRSPDDARAVFESMGSRNPASWTALISGFARSGRKSEAFALFERAPSRNLYHWTAMISGLVQSGDGVSAFGVFLEMRREGVEIIDPLVFSSVVGGCANSAVFELGRQVHGLVIALGFESCVYISNALVDMYAKCSDIASAEEVFGTIHVRDVVSWTSMIVGAAQHGRAEEALALYDQMVKTGIKPNKVTFVGLLCACSHAGLVKKGRELFKSMVDEHGIQPSLTHYTCFVDLLSRSGHLDEAESVIDSVPFELDEAIWASLLTACKHRGKNQMAIRIAERLLGSKIEDPSSYVLLSNVYAAANKWENVSNMRKLMSAMDVEKTPGYSSVEFGKERVVFFAGETSHPMRDEIFELLSELGEEMRKRGYKPDTSWVLHDMDEQEKEKQLFWHSERLAVAYALLRAVPGTTIRVVKNLRVCGDCHTVLKLASSIASREIVVRDARRFHRFVDGKCSCNDFW